MKILRPKNMGSNCLRLLFILCLCVVSYGGPPWSHYLGKPDEWFTSDAGKQVLENILSWQDANGIWPKNEDIDLAAFTGSRDELKGTFDNHATTDEMRMLARGFGVVGDERYKAAFLKGLDLILKAQYDNGGWPQYYPLRTGYYSHITFNDHTMVRLMDLLKEIAAAPEYGFVDEPRRKASKYGFDKGVECILKCQIRVNGNLTVWCAQHDEKDLSPRPARSYELASLSGMESADILRLLMRLDNPSAEIIQAITAGVRWYEESRVEGLRLDYKDGKLTAVNDATAPPLWARFYTLDTNRPFFCDRDGVPKDDFNQIGQERSTSYAWYGQWGQDVFRDYGKWKKRWQHLLVKGEPKFLLIVGDSTVCEYPENEPRRGWGQFIQAYFTDELKVVNHARSGRSTKTFIKEGLWDKALAVKPAYVLIQFGHNDSHDAGKPESTDAGTDFRENLRKYIDDARAIGAVPVLITPMYRRKFDSRGNISDNLTPYGEAMKIVAAETKTPLVDLQGASAELYMKLGPEKCVELANAPDDRTHLGPKGAQMMAELVMERLADAEASLNAYLKDSVK